MWNCLVEYRCRFHTTDPPSPKSHQLPIAPQIMIVPHEPGIVLFLLFDKPVTFYIFKLSYIPLCVCNFKTVSHSITQACLQLIICSALLAVIPLPRPPRYWNYRHELLFLEIPVLKCYSVVTLIASIF